MPAIDARRAAEAEQVHQRWVQAQRGAIERAAQAGQTKVGVHDAAPADDACWASRRAILHRAGFETELLPAARGATLVVRW